MHAQYLYMHVLMGIFERMRVSVRRYEASPRHVYRSSARLLPFTFICLQKESVRGCQADTGQTKKSSFKKVESVINTPRHRWGLLFIHLPSRSPSAEINGPCSALNNRRYRVAVLIVLSPASFKYYLILFWYFLHMG